MIARDFFESTCLVAIMLPFDDGRIQVVSTRHAARGHRNGLRDGLRQ